MSKNRCVAKVVVRLYDAQHCRRELADEQTQTTGHLAAYHDAKVRVLNAVVMAIPRVRIKFEGVSDCQSPRNRQAEC